MEVARDTLTDAVRRVAVALPRSNGVPAMEGIRLHGDGQGLVVEARSTQFRIKAQVKGPAPRIDALVHGGHLRELLMAARGQTVDLTDLGELVTIGAGQLRKLPLEEWPAGVPSVGKVLYKGPAQVMASTLEHAAEFASKDTVRPTIESVALDFSDGRPRVVATDSYRLLAGDLPGRVEDREVFLVSARIIRPLAKQLRAYDGDVGIYRAGKRFLRWSAPRITYVTELTEGQFPNWQQLRPGEPPACTMVYGPEEMRDLLRTALGWGEISFLLGNEIRVEAEDPERGRLALTLRTGRVTQGDDELAIGAFRVSVRYLASAVEATGAAPIQVRPGLKPLVLATDDRLAMVMPVREGGR